VVDRLNFVKHLGLCLFIPVSLAMAQTSTGEIDITVVDPTGAVIPNASVTITGADTGNLVRQLITNAAGTAAAPLLQPQTYNLLVAVPGFRDLARNGITLRVGDVLALRLQLEPGLAGESITVVGQTPLLEEKSSSLAQVIGEATIRQLPLSGRNYLDLGALVTGAVPSHGSRDNTFSSYGNSGIQNAFLLDGARNENYLRGLDNRARDMIRPPLDALAEFAVNTSNFSAQYGASAGAVIAAVTKSGTNRLHGSAYEFVRNSAFDARNFFAPASSTPLLVQNQYGGSIGGPLATDRAWLFGALERTSIRNDQVIRSTVPTVDMRNGVFGSSPIFDPSTTQCDSSGSACTRTQFPNNTIPPRLINPLGQAILSRYPLPNLPGPVNNYVRSSPQDSVNNNPVLRADVQLNPNNSMFSRLALPRFTLAANPGLPAPAQTPVNRTINSWGVGYGFTHIFSSTLVNELRFNWTRITLSQDATLARDEIIPGMLDPQVPSSIPTFNIQGFATIGAQPGCCGNDPLAKSSGVWDIADNVSKTLGRHLLKLGIEMIYIRPSTFTTLQGRGSLGFNGVFTQNPQSSQTRLNSGSPIADLLLGAANTLTTGTTGTSVERGHYLGGYFQDDWTLTADLTLNLGIRYELFFPYVETQDRMANFVLDPGSPDFGHLVLAGNPRFPRALVTTDKDNLAPRAGFAYRVRGIPELVVRGAYGIFYAQDDGLGVTSRMTNNPPFFGFGGATLVSDQLSPSTGFVLTPNATAPRMPPVDPAKFALDPAATFALVSWPLEYTTPYVHEWNLTVEKQLPWSILWETSYVGNIGTHLWGQSEGNQPLANGPGSPNTRRPLAQFTHAPIKKLGPWNRSRYAGVSTKLEKRYGTGVGFLAAFTYGNAIDLFNPAIDVCDGCNEGVQNSYNLNALSGHSDQDVPLRFTLSGTWNLPVGLGHRLGTNAWTRALLSFWEMDAIYQAQSGYPFTPVLSTDNANAGTTSWPDRVCDGKTSNWTIQRYFDTSCFVPPPRYQFGNTGRNVLFGPGISNLDFAVHRAFPVHVSEQARLEVRVEAFNVFNRAQFGQPGTVIGTQTAGVISGISGANRQLQFAVRLSF
jgi:hypothetical protein